MIRKALANAGMAPEEIDYIEAHGTGTALGDPIEMHALKAVFGKRNRPLHVGSVKTNIGHTEAAAGVAGLIKAIAMLRNQMLPPTLHFRRLNPHIDLGGVDIRVSTELAAADIGAIGVSSFGFSGTNAHIVLERAEAPSPRPAAEPAASPRLLISARTEDGLRELIGRYRDHLARTTDSFADICHTAAIGRARLPWWVAVGSAGELATAKPSNAPLPTLPVMSGRKASLPLVAFQRERFWIDTSTDDTAPAVLGIDDGLPPLLGRKLSLPFSSENRWEASVSPRHPALGFLAEHQVNGIAVMPASGFIEMVLVALPGHAIIDLEDSRRRSCRSRRSAARWFKPSSTSDGTLPDRKLWRRMAPIRCCTPGAGQAKHGFSAAAGDAAGHATRQAARCRRALCRHGAPRREPWASLPPAGRHSPRRRCRVGDIARRRR